MKRPFFNQEDRRLMRSDTLTGALLNYKLSVELLKRGIHRDNMWLIAKIKIWYYNRTNRIN